MIIKGFTELGCRDISLTSSFYLCLYKASEASKLYNFILHLHRYSKAMQLSETAFFNSLLIYTDI